jgi:hypothetical protein
MTRPPGAAGFNPAEPDTHRLRLKVPTTRLYIATSSGFLTMDVARDSGKRIVTSIPRAKTRPHKSAGSAREAYTNLTVRPIPGYPGGTVFRR